jgi:hypothetical protein
VKVEGNGKRAITDKVKRNQERNVEQENQKGRNVQRMTTKRKRILRRCSLQASFMFGASKSILRRNTKRFYIFHSSYRDTPCSGDMCPCCAQQAVCASSPTQCPCRGPAFVIALFGDASPIYCATCIPRPDNDEYRYERTAFQN